MHTSLDNHLNDVISSKQYLRENVLPLIIESSEIIAKCLLNEKKIITCGSGIASGVAQYFTSLMISAANYDKPAVPVVSICSGITEISSIAHYSGYKSIFSRQLQAIGQEKDILFVFSISGNEDEIIELIKYAYNKGIRVIFLTSNNDATAKKYLSPEDIIIVAPANNLGIRYEMQTTVSYCIAQIVDSLLFEA